MAAILGDFGAARRLLPHVSEGSNEGLSVDCCTRWYAAPEVLLSSNAYGLPSDVWSLGITITQMETGKAPFRNASNIGMMFDILKDLGTPPPSQWQEICDKSCYHGVTNTFLFPMFKPSYTHSCPLWGRKYGSEFVEFIHQMLQLKPVDRATQHQTVVPMDADGRRRAAAAMIRCVRASPPMHITRWQCISLRH